MQTIQLKVEAISEPGGGKSTIIDIIKRAIYIHVKQNEGVGEFEGEETNHETNTTKFECKIVLKD